MERLGSSAGVRGTIYAPLPGLEGADRPAITGVSEFSPTFCLPFSSLIAFLFSHEVVSDDSVESSLEGSNYHEL